MQNLKNINLVLTSLKIIIIILFFTKFLFSQAVPYTPLFTNATFTKTINVSLPVGTTAASADVSNGTARYSISIFLPSGSNGVEPNLSINYNSLGTNGVIGYGWGLSGMSMISRVNSDIYRDGNISPVDLSSNDKFILDGERLFIKSGIYGADLATYGKEAEDFSTTTSYGNYGGGPLFFKLETKDGIILEFGNTTDSRFLSADNTKVLYWALNRVIHKDGNYIDYKYQTFTNELLINEIIYTGNLNTGLLPYNKVKFNYMVREDKNTNYQVGRAIESNNLLTNITITTENNTAFKSYNLSYGNNNINSYLKEIQEFGSDGVGLNSTIFKYGDEPLGFEATTMSITSGSSIDVFSADFNADGLSDFLIADVDHVGSVKYHKGFRIFKRTSSNSTYVQTYSKTFPSSEYFKIVDNNPVGRTNAFMTGDFDGDNDDDISVVKLLITSDGPKVDYLQYYESVGDGYGFNISNKYFPSIPAGATKEHINPDGRSFTIGDFNGDSKPDMLFMNIYLQSAVWRFKVFISYNIASSVPTWTEVTCPVTPTIPVTSWVEASEFINILDFNGDGKSDIMVIDESQTDIFTFETNNDGTVKKIHGAGFPTKWHLCIFGDFNGDGKTDMLARNSRTNNSAPWTKAVSSGIGYLETSYSFTKVPNITGSYADDKLLISDFNSDGKQDIYHGYTYYPPGSWTASTARIDMYYSKGNNFNSVQHTYNNTLGFGPDLIFDLNGDGRADVVNRKSIYDPFFIFHFKRNGVEGLLHKVKNGVDFDIEFLYKRMNEGHPFYNTNDSHFYPLKSVWLPIYLVSQFKSENGIGGFSTSNYRYISALFHKQGKGFLGFRMVFKDNLVTNFTHKDENQVNTSFYVSVPYKSSTFITNSSTNLSEITTTNEVINLGNKRFWVRVNATYDDRNFEGQFVSSSFSYDTHGNITGSTTNINNIETKVISAQYGQFGTPRPAKITSETFTNTRNGHPSYTQTTTYGYNSIGQITSKTDFSGLPKQVVSTFGYNTLGNQISTTISPTNMTARTSSQVYDSKGRFVISSTNPLNQTTTYVNDIRWGKPTSALGINNIQLAYTYDAFGRSLTTYDPQRQLIVTTSYAWDVNASTGTIHTKTITHPGKPDTKEWFDILDREKRKDMQVFGNTWSSQYTTYDAKGNVATSTLPYKTGEAVLTTTNIYDSYNRLTSSSNNMGTNSYTYSYNGGNLTTTVTNPASQVKSKVTDATAKIISATDYGGTLTYTYYSHGNVKEVKQGTQVITSHLYDTYARQTQLIDINAGTTQYVTDALGQMTSMTTATNQTILYSYDIMGRKTYYGRPEGSTSYSYYPSGSGGATNQINTVSTYGSKTEKYNYDSFGRLSSKIETVDGIAHTTSYTYNNFDDMISQTYPSGFTCNYNYDANGYLINIKNGANTVTLYTQTTTNGLGNTTGYSMGNGKSSTIGYYFGLPTNYNTPGLQNLTLNWNYQTGNLSNRVDGIKNKTESFTYDNLNRLKTSTGSGLTSLSINYFNNGNIESKTDAGSYTYGSTKIHAVTSVSNGLNTIPTFIQDVIYTSFYQPSYITEGGNRIDFTYAAYDQRIKSVRQQNGSVVNTRYYFGDYEKDVTSGTTRHIHYITTPSGLGCIVERIGTTDTYHYTYTDHIGSILTVTNSSGIVEYEQNFDAWGRNRHASTWTYASIPSAPIWLYRGYTAHEHLPQFGLINMNGRLYDPIVGRMLSPDNNVQMPDYTQNFNRYSYALNNPLRFTDPDGEFIAMFIAAGIFWTESASNLIHGKSDPFGKAWKKTGNVVSEIESAFRFTIYRDKNTSISIGLSPLNFAISLNVSVKVSDAVVVNGGVAFGPGGFSGSGGVGFKSGDWDGSIGYGTNSKGSSFSGGIGYQSVAVGITRYNDNDGHPQTNWNVQYRNGDFRISMTNDAFLTGDEKRTAALDVAFGPYSMGFNLWTTSPPLKEYKERDLNPKTTTLNMEWESPIHRKNPFFTFSSGSRVYAGLYLGYNNGFMVSRSGIDAPWVQDFFQNGIHRWVVKGPYFNTDFGPSSRIFSQSIIYNPWGLY